MKFRHVIFDTPKWILRSVDVKEESNRLVARNAQLAGNSWQNAHSGFDSSSSLINLNREDAVLGRHLSCPNVPRQQFLRSLRDILMALCVPLSLSGRPNGKGIPFIRNATAFRFALCLSTSSFSLPSSAFHPIPFLLLSLLLSLYFFRATSADHWLF